ENGEHAARRPRTGADGTTGDAGNSGTVGDADVGDGGDDGGRDAAGATNAVVDVYDKLSSGRRARVRSGLLHGRMPAAEKDSVMQQFAEGTLDVLVTTTVVEVGVDVPNATVMVVLDAERYGISQLHQLRGR